MARMRSAPNERRVVPAHYAEGVVGEEVAAAAAAEVGELDQALGIVTLEREDRVVDTAEATDQLSTHGTGVVGRPPLPVVRRERVQATDGIRQDGDGLGVVEGDRAREGRRAAKRPEHRSGEELGIEPLREDHPGHLLEAGALLGHQKQPVDPLPCLHLDQHRAARRIVLFRGTFDHVRHHLGEPEVCGLAAAATIRVHFGPRFDPQHQLERTLLFLVANFITLITSFHQHILKTRKNKKMSF